MTSLPGTDARSFKIAIAIELHLTASFGMSGSFEEASDNGDNWKTALMDFAVFLFNIYNFQILERINYTMINSSHIFLVFNIKIQCDATISPVKIESCRKSDLNIVHPKVRSDIVISDV